MNIRIFIIEKFHPSNDDGILLPEYPSVTWKMTDVFNPFRNSISHITDGFSTSRISISHVTKSILESLSALKTVNFRFSWLEYLFILGYTLIYTGLDNQMDHIILLQDLSGNLPLRLSPEYVSLIVYECLTTSCMNKL